MKRWDVIIVGGGSAGSAAAHHVARRGLATLLLERRALDDAGACWVNGVHRRAFDEAELAAPSAPELRASAHRFHLFAGWGPTRVVIEDSGILDVDMRHLVRRLRDGARAAGAELREHARVTAARPGEVVCEGGERLAATLVIDASGLGGVFASDKPRAADVCTAAQGVYAVADSDAARAFFAARGASVGETMCFASVAGGYSMVGVRLEAEGRELSILTGSLPALGFASGRELRDRFAAGHAWIGPMLFGGQAPIPLHRPRRRLAFADDGGRAALVRLGDAAGQVYAAHGSGVGAQLVAGHMLAERVVRDGAARGAKRFEQAWHARFGPHFLAADAFRRATTWVSPRSLEVALRRGLLPRPLIRFGLAAGV